MTALRILGIDPGSVNLGIAVIDAQPSAPQAVAIDSVALAARGNFAQRLGAISLVLDQWIEAHRPAELAIEQIFMYRSPESSLKLAQARGVVIASAVRHGLSVHEYMPAVVKQAVVGTGRADKVQVAHMVCRLLSLSTVPSKDATDAAAIALCHLFRRRSFAVAEQAELAPAKAELLRQMAQTRHRRRSGEAAWTEVALERARKRTGGTS
ncbi:crossover junction endodeoxyribonuclease RuvC [Halothiobacillus sp. DCM-1]|uniref:crossover junction endodeoxyribonuclease RuvC n=1 Tax=Halothiobacillus sp. DCM-1 TaxID=3112558 RepID=UPI0032497A07